MNQDFGIFPNGHLLALNESDGSAEEFELFANAHRWSFEKDGDVKDLNRAIELQEDTLFLLPSGDSDTLRALNDLARLLHYRFGRLAKRQDIERVIEVHESIVGLTPDGHSNKPGYLSDLGNWLQLRFKQFGELQDLETAIEVQSKSISITPDGYPHKPMFLNNLGASLARRFERLGNLQDLEMAIELHSESVSLTSDGDPDKAAWLSNLGMCLCYRFKQLGELQDIERAIDALGQSVSLTPDGHFEKPAYLTNLGSSLESRFTQLGELQDIERATEVHAQSVSLTPDGRLDKPMYLNNLGNSLMSQFAQLGDLQDLERATEAYSNSVSLTLDGHPDKLISLNNLGGCLRRRFEQLGEPQDIERAIELCTQSVSLTPEDHPNKACSLCNLGVSYIKRLKDVTDVDKAIHSFRMAATSITGSPSMRFEAARRWTKAFELKPQYSTTEKLEAYRVLVRLVPELIWLGLPIYRRYQIIVEDLGQSINDAAATAIQAGELQLAIEWMEQGRTIIWGQLMNLRSPLDDLRAYDTTLADNLEYLSRPLEMWSFRGISSNSSKLQDDFDHSRPSSTEEVARIFRRIVHEREQLLKHIRSLSGFESFLLPKGFAQLSEAARCNPVVMINISKLRCDAVALFHPSSTPIHIHLLEFCQDLAKALHSSLVESLKLSGIRARHNSRGSCSLKENNLESVMKGLWSLVVQPIVQGIEGFLFDNAVDHLPHITWCPTGHLSFLPLHAAGMYGLDDHRFSLLDFAVSSYIPTLTTMINLQAKRTRISAGSPRMLLVTQPNTFGHKPLGGTLREAEIIKKEIFREYDHCCHLTGEQATPSAVLDAMDKYDWVHFACHGTQDFVPTNSAFILHDGTLRLISIMEKSLGNAHLAFLSACETATGNEMLPEEALHLTSGMLAAGYPQVVSTMWSIMDWDAPSVVETFYKDLLAHQAASETGGSASYAAYALHTAVKRLREEVGEKDFLRWVPFVHFGV